MSDPSASAWSSDTLGTRDSLTVIKGISRVLIDPKGRIIVGGAEPDRFVVERYLT